MWLPWNGQPTGSHLRYPCRKENCFTWLSTNTSRDHTKVSNSWSPSNRETPTNPATPYGCSFSLKSSSVGPEPHLMARRQQSYGCLTLQLAQSKEHRQWFHTGLPLLFNCEPNQVVTRFLEKHNFYSGLPFLTIWHCIFGIKSYSDLQSVIIKPLGSLLKIVQVWTRQSQDFWCSPTRFGSMSVCPKSLTWSMPQH